MARGKFEGHLIVKHRDTAVICAKMAEPNQMLFGLWAGIDGRSHVLDGGPAMLRDIAIATNFGMQFVAIGFRAITLDV